MYTEFYGLKEKPFNLTPSPRFLYLGESHREALALLTYGVLDRKGFILLTGEVGTGKTTIVQALLTTLTGEVQCVHLSNPLLSPRDFILYLGHSVFKNEARFRSKTEFLLKFESFLRQCLQHQKNFVLIIDEAHKLSFELLEEIRLLSNMETAEEKLINIFLVGQPELLENLQQPRCRPLLQRISVRHHISPLNLDETEEYLKTRLRSAGGRDVDRVFSKDVIKELHQYSMGYPRMINILADNVLLTGYSKGMKTITRDMVEECYEDLSLEGIPGMEVKDRDHVPAESSTESGPVRKRKSWRWAAVFILLGLTVGLGISRTGQDFWREWIGFVSGTIHSMRKETDNAAIGNGNSRVSYRINHEEKAQPIVQVPDEEVKEIPKAEKPEPMEATNEDNPPEPVRKTPEVPERILVVRQGDTLLELITKAYGFTDQTVLELVRQRNPEIKDINRIEVGQEIHFPPLPRHQNGASAFTVHIASFKPVDYAINLFQKLVKEGYEAYIIPVQNPETGKVFRVTLGSFDDREKAEAYASEILRKGIADYAETVRLEMR